MEDQLTLPQIVDGLSAPIATTTADGRVDLVNQHFLDYLGMSLEELKDWETSGAVHPDDLPRVVTAWRKSLERGRAVRARATGPPRRRQLSMGSGSRPPVTRYRGSHPALVRAARRHRRAQARRSAPGRREAAPRDGRVRVSSSGRSRGMCGLVETVVSNSTCSVLLIEPNGKFRHGAGPTLPQGYDGTVNGAPVLLRGWTVWHRGFVERTGDRARSRRGPAVGRTRVADSGLGTRPQVGVLHADCVVDRQGVGYLCDLPA